MPAPRGIVQWLDQELHKSQLLPRHARLLVAVSGGADSVALLRLLVEINRAAYWNWQLVVGHVDHSIRGAVSAADAAWVRQLSAELDLPCDTTTLTLPPDTSEALARTQRFQALADIVSTRACAGVVLAHHADDLAETVLMRIFRGCGIDGLIAMRDQSILESTPRLTVWRPLLRLRHSQLLDHLHQLSQTWRTDETNSSAQFLRNRLRAEVFPVIENLWPTAVDALGRLSQIAADAQEALKAAEHTLWQSAACATTPTRLEFSRPMLREALPVLTAQLLRNAIETLSGTTEIADHQRIAETVRLIRGTEGGKTIQMGRGIAIELVGPLVRIGREISPVNADHAPVEGAT